MKRIAIIALVLVISKRKNLKKRIWVKNWQQKRNHYIYENLLNELRITELNDFKKFLRTDEYCFDEFLTIISPLIKKQNTLLGQSIPQSQ